MQKYNQNQLIYRILCANREVSVMNAVSVFFVSPLAGSAFYHMTLFPLSDWLDDQVSALWDAGVCKDKKPKNAVSVFCRFGIL